MKATGSICHLSILNPAIHPRIFYKWALSQAQRGFSVSIMAQDVAAAPYKKEGVHIIPQKPFKRLSWQRLTSPWKLLKQIRKAPADLYVIHSPELLALALWLKWRYKVKVLYDVHEDYQLNIRHATYYPPGFRHLMAWIIRRWECWTAGFLDGIAYAEACYENILALPPDKYIILENTFTKRMASQKVNINLPNQPYLLLSGTLAEERGLFQSLELWAKINQHQPQLLVVAGFCPIPALLERVHEFVKNEGLENQFLLVGGADYVPNAEMLQWIAHCQAGFFLYRPAPNLLGKRPTKIFEYMAFQKPLIFYPEPHWLELNGQWNFGLAYDAAKPVEVLLDQLKEWIEHPVQHATEDYLWEAGAEKVLAGFMERFLR